MFFLFFLKILFKYRKYMLYLKHSKIKIALKWEGKSVKNEKCKKIISLILQ